ncbi:bifunctional 2',3'-cyclic-nucleotide 2'-phosphodiesterase/3'-nucleotidase [Loktanella sp. Alg231-35]|uniref:bifunctional 2',3'-cyclic-nucleotide 2'-phosphodiesterase/3'-nucleotidase n=1 Tax=Loktanella sp. Alg231-35 TaxID=1922220 RepID=UPI000D555A84|nr:bifunctional 2',3'-cyclic-nucleotide 2'-phosphodiesterase/3'-nucleotidase [Loktanella sp. Alg231-35]
MDGAAPPTDHYNPAQGRLRILATTDLHMQLLGYDYFADRPDHTLGLVNLAATIARLRDAPDITTILCDNGDLIQGTPLADFLADTLHPNDTHPMIAALNLLIYDAMTLGNHDFDFGLGFLRQALRGAQFPIVSANIHVPEGDALAQPFAILKRDVRCNDGHSRPIRIGITGFGPPQIADWDYSSHDGLVATDDIVGAAERIVPKIKAAGADIIIALCHSGIGAVTPTARMENAAVPLAAVPGIDVIVAGHTHDRFPDAERPVTAGVDPVKGTLHGKPTVLASSFGKALGVIDLDLGWQPKGWTIKAHTVRLERPAPQSTANGPLQDQLGELVQRAHDETLRQMRQPIAQTSDPIHSYFATVAPDLPQQLLAKAMQDTAKRGLAANVTATMPLLAATAPFRFGGRSGLGQFISIPPGPITLHDAAAIFPFADRLVAVRRTGLELMDWLERAASYYNQITPDTSGQSLNNPLYAGYHCDTISDLHYEIDLTQPARFDAHGKCIRPHATRINALCWNGHPVAATDQFVVATTSFRAQGGGGFVPVPEDDVLYRSKRKMRAVLVDYLTQLKTIDISVTPNWRFAPNPGATATFESAVEAAQHLPANIALIGPTRTGLSRYQIRF